MKTNLIFTYKDKKIIISDSKGITREDIDNFIKDIIQNTKYRSLDDPGLTAARFINWKSNEGLTDQDYYLDFEGLTIVTEAKHGLIIQFDCLNWDCRGWPEIRVISGNLTEKTKEIVLNPTIKKEKESFTYKAPEVINLTQYKTKKEEKKQEEEKPTEEIKEIKTTPIKTTKETKKKPIQTPEKSYKEAVNTLKKKVKV